MITFKVYGALKSTPFQTKDKMFAASATIASAASETSLIPFKEEHCRNSKLN